jgi:tRNA wybutosine-synthesizing protein 2
MKGKVIGDIMVVKNSVNNPQELLKTPGINRIVKLGYINGPYRQPDVEIIWGTGTETIHKENNCFFKIDVSKVMWSKGNTTERMRMAKIPEKNEVIVDLFAGIGYFTIPMGVHSSPKKIYSVEINPVSYHYLRENIVLNNLEDTVEPILGDCSDFPHLNIADRVLMGYIGNTHEYLPVAMKVLKPGGVLHYHEAVPEKLLHERPVERIKAATNGLNVEILHLRIIKKYSPGVFHIVVDACIG